MSCGCAPSARDDAGTSPTGGGGGEAERVASCAAMCLGCLAPPFGQSPVTRGGLVPVTCGGVRVEHRILRGRCPRGKYAKAWERGKSTAGTAVARKGEREEVLTRWLLVRWRGVPLPLRWWAWLLTVGENGSSARRPGDYAGCGCADRLKRVTEWLWALTRPGR